MTRWHPALRRLRIPARLRVREDTNLEPALSGPSFRATRTIIVRRAHNILGQHGGLRLLPRLRAGAGPAAITGGDARDPGWKPPSAHAVFSSISTTGDLGQFQRHRSEWFGQDRGDELSSPRRRRSSNRAPSCSTKDRGAGGCSFAASAGRYDRIQSRSAHRVQSRFRSRIRLPTAPSCANGSACC